MEDELNKVQNPIFVFLGIEQYVNLHYCNISGSLSEPLIT